MKISLVIVAAVFTALSGATPPKAQPEGPHVRIVDVDEEDRGLVPPGVSVERRAHLVNTTSSVLKVRLVQKTCGCVAFSLEHDRIAPGEFTEVMVGTTAVEAIGPQRHGAELEVVKLDADERPSQPQRFTIWYHYTPDLDFTVVPERVELDVVQGDDIAGTVFLHRFAVDHLAIKRAVCDIPGVTVDVPRLSDVNPDVLRLPLVGRSVTPGLQVGRLEIEIAGTRNPRVVIPVAVRTAPAVVFQPAAVVCHHQHLKDEYVFVASARDGRDALLLSLTADTHTKGVEAFVERAPGTTFIRVKLDRSVLPQTGFATVDVKAGDMAGTPIRLVWFGR